MFFSDVVVVAVCNVGDDETTLGFCFMARGSRVMVQREASWEEKHTYRNADTLFFPLGKKKKASEIASRKRGRKSTAPSEITTETP
jgi:hypothetical protein